MINKLLPIVAIMLAATLVSSPSKAATIAFDQTKQSPYFEDGFTVDPARIVNGNCYAGSCLGLNKHQESTLTATNGDSFSLDSFWFQFLGKKAELTVTAYSGTSIVDMIVLAACDFPHNNGGQFLQHLFDNVTSITFANTGKGNVRIDNVTAAPIPAALPLFASALAGIGVFARRRKANRVAAI